MLKPNNDREWLRQKAEAEDGCYVSVGCEDMGQGHGRPCYYCGKPCDAMAGDASQWPVWLCHEDKPGVEVAHHRGCVTQRLDKLDRLERIFSEIAGKII